MKAAVCLLVPEWAISKCSADRVQALCYLQPARQLKSPCSSDGGIAVWNMDVSREEVRESKAGLMQGEVTACLLGFPPLGGDAGSPSSSSLRLLVAVWTRSCVSRRHCDLHSLESFHQDKQYTHLAHLG